MLAIVTDSTAALTEKEAQMLGVRMVRIPYMLDNTAFMETFSGRNGDYIKQFETAAKRVTLPPSAISFLQVFSELITKGFDVLCIVLSSRLSGTYRSAMKAAEEFEEGRVRVIDSLSSLACIEYMIRRAREMENDGARIDEIVSAMQEQRQKQLVLFSVEKMETLRNHGRSAGIRQSVGTVLNSKPIFEVADGVVRPVATARGTQSNAKLLVEQMPADTSEVTLYHFGRGTDSVTETFHAVRARFGNIPVRVKDGGPVLSINIGSDSVAAVWRIK